MAEVKLSALVRKDVGKGAARRSRREGKVPAVLYGRGMEPVVLEVDRREFVTALHTEAGMNVLLDLEIDGKTTLALTRELQRDPVKGTLLHADFVKVDRKTAIEVEVPVHVTGEAPGVKSGGILEQPLFTVHVRCLPTNVPEHVVVDISSLDVGDSLRVLDIAAPEGVDITNDPETVVVSIAAPISEAELEAMEAEAGIEMEAPAEEAEEEAPEEGAEEAPGAEEEGAGKAAEEQG